MRCCMCGVVVVMLDSVGCWMNDTKRMAQQARQNLKFGAPERRFFAKMSLAPEAAADDDGVDVGILCRRKKEGTMTMRRRSTSSTSSNISDGISK